MKQELIPKIELQPSDPKKKFLAWLDRFAYLGDLKTKIVYLQYSDEELERLKPQIEARYRLKKKYMDQLKKQA